MVGPSTKRSKQLLPRCVFIRCVGGMLRGPVGGGSSQVLLHLVGPIPRPHPYLRLGIVPVVCTSMVALKVHMSVGRMPAALYGTRSHAGKSRVRAPSVTLSGGALWREREGSSFFALFLVRRRSGYEPKAGLASADDAASKAASDRRRAGTRSEGDEGRRGQNEERREEEG